VKTDLSKRRITAEEGVLGLKKRKVLKLSHSGFHSGEKAEDYKAFVKNNREKSWIVRGLTMEKSLLRKKKGSWDLGCERMVPHKYGVKLAPERHGRQRSGLCLS